MKEYWYFTFGCGHLMHNYIIRIEGTYEETREKMCEQFGNKWCGQYSEEEVVENKFFKDYMILTV